MSSYRTYLWCVLLLLLVGDVSGQSEPRHVAVVIGGLGGAPEYSEKFEQYLFDTRKGLIDNFGFAEEDVHVLGEASIVDQSFVDDLSNSDNIRALFQELSSSLGESDVVYVFLYGHGSYDGTNSMLNIPRRDLSDADYADLVDGLGVGQVVFINAASASGPFVDAISGDGRIVVTATRSGTEKNETTFAEYVARGLLSGDADMDRNGRVSILEVFKYAAESTARSYETAGLLASEHSLLEDTGDRRGFEYDELETNGEGNIAAVVYLGQRDTMADTSSRPLAGDALNRRNELERGIAELKSRKATMDVDDYYDALEVLFVELARLGQP